jgi:hypothetical protein
MHDGYAIRVKGTHKYAKALTRRGATATLDEQDISARKERNPEKVAEPTQ